jgi:hypothetical protein
MAKLGDLVVRIGADTRDLNKSLGRVQRNMRSMTSNVQSLGRSISQSLTLPLAGMAAISVQAFRDQAKAVAQVEQGLKSTGNAAGKTVGELTKMATELQRTTLFGDEDILQNATAQLLTFTNIAGKQFDRTQKAALDLATRLDGDLKSASIQLGKALNDPIANLSALSRSGIQFSKEQKELIKTLAETGDLAKAQTIILDELEKQYGGSAEAAAAADGGITQLQNAIGDLGEDIGKIITQNLRPFIKRVMTIVEGFQGLDEGVKRAIVALGGLAAAFGPILFFLPQIITQLGLLATAIAANPILAAAGVITAIGVALKAMTTNANNATKSIQELRNSFGDLTPESSAEKLEETKKQLRQLLAFRRDFERRLDITREFSKYGGERQKQLRAYEATLSEAEKAEIAFGTALARNSELKGDAANMTEAIDNAIIALQNQMAALTPKMVENTEVVEEQAQAYQSFGGAIEESMHAITDFSDKAGQARMTMGQFFSMLENVQVQAQETKQEFIDMGDVIRQALSGIASAFDGTGNFIMKGLRILGDLMVGIGNQMIQLATAMKAFRKFIITNPGLAIAAGVGFVIAGTALSNMAQRNLEMPALAEGGVAFGPTMALIGDNKNASIDPEVVAPLSKLRDMMGGNQVEVFGRISGNDIFLSNARAGTNRNRYA